MSTPPVITSTIAGPGWAPDVITTLDPDAELRDALLITCGTRAGEATSDRSSILVPYVRTDPPADIVPEGVELPTGAMIPDQLELRSHKVAVITTVSRELTEQPQAVLRISRSLTRSVIAKADAVFLTHGADPVGLLNVPGVVTGGDLGGATNANLHALWDAQASIEADGGAATQLLMSPAAWAALAKVPVAAGWNTSLLADAHVGAERVLGGIPVIVHRAIPAGTALLIDSSEVITAYGPLEVARSNDAAFYSDSVAVRATWRIAFGIVRPARVVALTVAAD